MEKKAVQEVSEGSEKTEFSSEFEDVVDVDYLTSLRRGHKKAKGAHISGVTILTAIVEKLEYVEYKVDRLEKACWSRLDRMDERLGFLERSCSSINALVRTVHKATKGSSALITQDA